MREFCLYDDFGEMSEIQIPMLPREKKMSIPIYEDDGGMEAAAEDFATKQLMSQGMSVVLGWIDAGDFSFEALDVFIQGVSDLDGDGEVQEGGEEENYYNDMFGAVADAMYSLGADDTSVSKFIGEEDNDAGAAIGVLLSDKIGALEAPDDEIISNYVLGLEGGQIMESMVKQVRGGEVTWGRKKLHRHTQISSERRAGLKKARLKSHTAAATRNRRHSLKIRKSRGM